MEWWRWLVLLGFLCPVVLCICAAIMDGRDKRRRWYPDRDADTEEIMSYIERLMRAKAQEGW